MAGLVEVEGCDISQKNSMGRTGTPLGWAARNGHEEVVRILLGQDDIDPDKPDQYGRTPLRSAAYKGREGVAKLLLERDDVNPARQARSVPPNTTLGGCQRGA